MTNFNVYNNNMTNSFIFPAFLLFSIFYVKNIVMSTKSTVPNSSSTLPNFSHRTSTKTVVFIKLKNGIWWPGYYYEKKDNDFVSSEQLLYIKLFGTEKDIILPLIPSNRDVSWTDSEDKAAILTTQRIPSSVHKSYLAAMVEFNNGKTYEKPFARLKPLLSSRITKRLGAILWDDYFMAIAFLSAQRRYENSKYAL
jgi:hypothetical protein